MPELTIAEVARIAEGAVEGDGGLRVRGMAPLDEAGPDELSFVAEARYHPYIPASRAGAVLVPRDARVELPPGMAAVRVDDPRRALARILPVLYPDAPPAPGVHPTAVVAPGVQIAPSASIAPYAVVGEGTTVGERARIGAHTVVGRGCRIGDDVEVGANTTIDRGSIGDTVVGQGTKIDNLVQIGHNCRIGRHAIIVSQVGISGSTKVGDGAVLGGQVGVQGHITIGAGARVGGQSGVFGDVADGQTVSGYPARPHREALRTQAALFRLPEALARLKKLEQAVLGRGGAAARESDSHGEKPNA